MCLQYIRLKTKNLNATKYGYVPCGKCVECRKAKQDEWKFRLNAEFLKLKKQGWNVAFCTLTYDNKQLPHIPKELFKKEEDYKEVACFSRTDVQNWIGSVRQYFKYHNGFKNGDNIRYFVASEYGSNTHRPHYHAILAWPQRVDYQKMHAVCSHFWNKGFMFPRKPEGDKGMLPFEVVGDMSKAMNYVSKYACKDVDFEDTVEKLNLNTKMRIYRDVRSFHLQSKSMGFEIIKDMSDKEKRDVFVHGISFQGDGQVYKIPLYIKNRIVFDNYYVVKPNGERLVRRKASEFFEKYKNEMFVEKAKFYEKVFEDTSKEYYIKQGVSESQAEQFENAINCYKDRCYSEFGFDVFGSGVFGQYYMCYFGVDQKHCRVINSFDDAVKQWMRRYHEKEDEIPENEVVDYNCWKSVQDLCSMILGAQTFCNINIMYQKEKSERLSKKINDYFNNVLGGLIKNAV